MKVSELIKDMPVLKVSGDMNANVNSIEYDSRKLQVDSLFVCISGFTIDGHDFIEKAIENGTRVFLVEKDIVKDGCTFIQVKNTRESMAKLACKFYENPSSHLSVIGVTGTNGKTSITHMIKEILEMNNKKTGLIGTIKNVIGDTKIQSQRTTPESVELQQYFSQMKEQSVKYCLMEVSSHALKLNRVDCSEFEIGIFTNLTEDHLDFHKNMQDYKDSKKRLFYKTKKANIINIDDKYGFEIYKEVKNLNTKCYSYAIEKDADFKACDIKIYPTYVKYKLITKDFQRDVVVNIPGRFTVYNTLAVICACYCIGMDIDDILSCLKKTSGVPGRFETINSNDGFSVIIDYAHTPDALENILDTAREFVSGNIITVFGCGGNRDTQKRHLMGDIAQRKSSYTIVTSDNPRHEKPMDIISDILKGMNLDAENFKVIVDRKDAIQSAISMAKKDDIVIIAGKGHEDYQIIKDEKIHFDDKEMALMFLKEE